MHRQRCLQVVLDLLAGIRRKLEIQIIRQQSEDFFAILRVVLHPYLLLDGFSGTQIALQFLPEAKTSPVKPRFYGIGRDVKYLGRFFRRKLSAATSSTSG